MGGRGRVRLVPLCADRWSVSVFGIVVVKSDELWEGITLVDCASVGKRGCRVVAAAQVDTKRHKVRELLTLLLSPMSLHYGRQPKPFRR